MVIDKDNRPPGSAVDKRFYHFERNGRTAMASAQTTVLPDKVFRNVFSPMHHYGTLVCFVVDSVFQTNQAERIAVFALVRLIG